MSLNNFFSMIDPRVLKEEYTHDEYVRVRKMCYRVNATTLYKLYKEFTQEAVPYTVFYGMLKKHLYYDKYICYHGTEFIYYVRFKPDSNIYVNSETPRDVLNIVPAVSKTKGE